MILDSLASLKKKMNWETLLMTSLKMKMNWETLLMTSLKKKMKLYRESLQRRLLPKMKINGESVPSFWDVF